MEVKFQNATPPTNRRHFFPILANVVLIFPPIGRHKTTLRNIGILSFRFLVTFCGYISSNDLICVQGNKLGQNAPGSGLRFFSEFFLPLDISSRYMARSAVSRILARKIAASFVFYQNIFVPSHPTLSFYLYTLLVDNMRNHVYTKR